MSQQNELARQIIKYRDTHNISKLELAQMLDMRNSHLHDICYGHRKPNNKEMRAIENLIGEV